MGSCVGKRRKKSTSAIAGSDTPRARIPRNLTPGVPKIPRSNVPLQCELHREENKKRHRCEQYDVAELVVRRGSPFKMSLSVSAGDMRTRGDRLLLQFTTDPGYQVSLPVEGKVDGQHGWNVQVVSKDKKKMVVEVQSDARAPVGVYKLEVAMTDANGKKVLTKTDDFYLLFNPWNKEDTVFVDDELKIGEYVLNTEGMIWTGSASDIDPVRWDFRQFKEPCLKAALALVEKGKLDAGARGNPVVITRVLSALTNHADDDGVIEGRWEPPYADGVEPWVWVDSETILTQYMKQKKPVRYGQCWVFAAVVTTLLRALGIPTRIVTTFESAHDTNRNIDADLVPGELNEHNLWNFHVWNESFFRRPDLPEGFDGWQACDATPQERSQGIMQCGPASIKAVKVGRVDLPFDGAFVFAMVNADLVYWQKRNGHAEPFRVETDVVGQRISTKMVGSFKREDVTEHYKYAEGTPEEREAMREAKSRIA